MIEFEQLLEPARKRAAVALSVNASEGTSCGGAQADLLAFAACAVHGATVLTGVRPFSPLPERLLMDQLRATARAHPVDALKIGDVSHPDLAAALSERLPELFAVPVVLDPELVDPRGEARHPVAMPARVLDCLAPLADVMVLNARECALIAGRPVEDLSGLRETGKRVHDHGARHVLLCSGRLEGHAVDLLYDGRDFVEFGRDRQPKSELRGQGSTLGAALTAQLARGLTLIAAVEASVELVDEAIRGALVVGRRRPVQAAARAWAALGIDPEPLELAEPATPRA